MIEPALLLNSFIFSKKPGVIPSSLPQRAFDTLPSMCSNLISDLMEHLKVDFCEEEVY